MNRLFDDATRKQEKLEHLRISNVKHELESNKEKPKISARSSKIVAQREENKVPIHERFEKMMARKERKLKEMQEELLEKKKREDPEAFNPSFKPTINKKSLEFAE